MPTRMLAISTFYDPNAELIRRVHRSWPKCKLELVAQQGTSNLPVKVLRKSTWKPLVSEIRNSSRRLHTKLVSWPTGRSVGCLVGSANFTSATFDGRNIEACLYVPDAKKAAESLFDSKLPKRKIAVSEFEPGEEEEQKPEHDEVAIRLDSAVLAASLRLRIRFTHNIEPLPSTTAASPRGPAGNRRRRGPALAHPGRARRRAAKQGGRTRRRSAQPLIFWTWSPWLPRAVIVEFSAASVRIERVEQEALYQSAFCHPRPSRERKASTWSGKPTHRFFR